MKSYGVTQLIQEKGGSIATTTAPLHRMADLVQARVFSEYEFRSKKGFYY